MNLIIYNILLNFQKNVLNIVKTHNKKTEARLDKIEGDIKNIKLKNNKPRCISNKISKNNFNNIKKITNNNDTLLYKSQILIFHKKYFKIFLI